MKRLSILFICLFVPLFAASGIGTSPHAVHADSGKINWSQVCAGGSDFGAPSHGTCVSSFQAVYTFSQYCDARLAQYGSSPFVLTFYGDLELTQIVAGPFIVTNKGSCMSAFAHVKGTAWRIVFDTPSLS